MQKELIETRKKAQQILKKMESDLESTKDSAQNEYNRLVHDLEAGMSRKIDPTIFDTQNIGKFEITTGFEWSTIKDLVDEKKHVRDWCYLMKPGTEGRYFYDGSSQFGILKLMGITKKEADSYEKYCRKSPPRIR